MAGSPTPRRRTAPTALDDAALESEYAAALESYIGRLETFACVPPCFTSDGIRETHADLDGHGIAPGEWFEYLQMRVEHIAEGERLAALASERLDRIQAKERDRMAGLDVAQLHDVLAALQSEPRPTAMAVQGESVREAIVRRERDRELIAVYIARIQGIAEAVNKMFPQPDGKARRRAGRAR